jgi:uncharacterized protein YvpB
MLLRILNSTFMKFDIVQSSTITSDNLKTEYNKGDTVEVNWYRQVDNHYLVELTSAHKGRFNWYFFIPHVEIILDEIKNPVKLPVPYFSQRDNALRPSQTCNVTCCAMVIEYFHPKKYTPKIGQLEDSLTLVATKLWGADSIYYHDKLVLLMAKYQVKSVFNTKTSFDDMKRSLDKGNPVIYSGRFTRSGHIIVLTGYDDNGFIVNDPYGEWFSSGYFQHKPGNQKHYSYSLITSVSYSGTSHGWAHLTSKM